MMWIRRVFNGSILGAALSAVVAASPPNVVSSSSTTSSALLAPILPLVPSVTAAPSTIITNNVSLGSSTTPSGTVSTSTLTKSAISLTTSSLPMAAAQVTAPPCKICGYSVLGTTLTYSENAVISTINVTATQLTFTYIYPNGSTSLDYSLVANYTPSANLTVPFTSPTAFGEYQTPPTWVYGNQTLTAGTTYSVVTGIQATSYGPSQTAVPRFRHKRLLIKVPTLPTTTTSDSCTTTSITDSFTDIPAFASTNTAASILAISSALAEFFDDPSVLSAFGTSPSCTPALLSSSQETAQPAIVPLVVPHIIPQIVPAPEATQAPSTYVTASVLTANGPGSVIRIAPTGGAAAATTQADTGAGAAAPHEQFKQTAAPVPVQVSPGSPTDAPSNDPPASDPAGSDTDSDSSGSDSPASDPNDPIAVPENQSLSPGETLRQGNAIAGQVQPTEVQAVPTPVTVGGQTIVPVGGGSVSVDGKTVAPGAVATLANGVPISVGPGGSKVVVGTQTANLINPPSQAPVVLPGGATVTPAPGGNGIIVGGQTITAGGTATLANGEAVSVESGGGGSVVVVNGQTVTLPPPTTAQPAVVVNGETITPVASGVAVDGMTLTPGQILTLPDSQVVSVGTSGIVAVGNSTVQIATPALTSSSSLITTTSTTPFATNTGPTTTGKPKKGDGNALRNVSLGVQVGIVIGLIGSLSWL